MAENLGIEDATQSQSCTACHSPMKQVAPAAFAKTFDKHGVDKGVSCASCHGGEEKWLLSHTRPEYPRDALAQLGMRPLATAYQRANSCVACHQNLEDKLLDVKHPPLVFELDGLLVAEPKHWREAEGFSNAQTWLVGQAVALREMAAQARREPGDIREAEIQAASALLNATETNWDGTQEDMVRAADDFAKRISSTPMNIQQGRAILKRLLINREAFQEDAFASVAEDYRMLAVGHYAERLTLAVDRLNQSLVASGERGAVKDVMLNELFVATKPPKSFDAATMEAFVLKLDRVADANLNGE